MSDSAASKQDSVPPTLQEVPQGEVDQLLAGLERQKEELGPIADELIELLRAQRVLMPKARTTTA